MNEDVDGQTPLQERIIFRVEIFRAVRLKSL